MAAADSLERAVAHHQAGRLAEAERCYRELIEQDPLNASALHLLGVLLHQRGSHLEALNLIRSAIDLSPRTAHFHSNLASVLGRVGRASEAVESARSALQLCPDLPEAYNNLGSSLESLGKFAEAAVALRRAISLRPSYVEAHTNLGNVLQRQGHFSEAIAQHRRALEHQPDCVAAYANLATTYGELGRSDDSIACYRKVFELRPDDAAAHSDLLFALNYNERYTREQVFRAHVEWAERHARPLYPSSFEYPNVPDPARRLKVGYVSPYLRSHPVARFIEPVLSHHDHDAFEIVCYHDSFEDDDTTGRLKPHADRWRHIAGIDDETLAELVRADGIDILVDLTGHIAGNRLLTFARKPAPLQVTYLGYPNTTGLATMDYRITDSAHDPPGHSERYHTERLLRIDPCCWCYDPGPEGRSRDPGSDRPGRSGHITFGSMNRLIKVTPRILRLWAQVLEAVPGSRLQALAPANGAAEPTIINWFAEHGIEPRRLVLAPRVGRADYLAEYRELDVLLDSFPYAGHTTTCDALWMGVPVITLAGTSHVSRAGASVLAAVGLGDLVTNTDEEYVRRATLLAFDARRRDELRKSLRHNVVNSVLMRPADFAGRLEHALRDVWQVWCDGSRQKKIVF